MAGQRPLSPTDIMPITEAVATPDNTAADPGASSIERAPGRLPSDGKVGAGGGPSPMAIPAGLDYGAMVTYALTYWTNYNPAYRNFSANGGGGDCTNFVSQALRAGGWQDAIGWYQSNDVWWYNSANQSYTWAGAQNWSRFAPQRTTWLANIWYMERADVLQLDFNKDGSKDHTMIVTKKTSSEIYMTYHTADHINRTLSSLQAIYANSAWWYSYRT